MLKTGWGRAGQFFITANWGRVLESLSMQTPLCKIDGLMGLDLVFAMSLLAGEPPKAPPGGPPGPPAGVTPPPPPGLDLKVTL